MLDTIIMALATIIASIASAVVSAKITKNKMSREVKETSENMLAAREDIEEKFSIDSRVRLGLGIKELRIMNFASTAILSPDIVDYIGQSSKNELSERIEKLLLKENVKLTLLITAPGSYAAEEAISSEKVINMNMDITNRKQIFYQAYAGIHSKIQENGIFNGCYKEGRFQYRITNIALPYAIFQVKYVDPRKDHIKIDLYSPYISRES